MFTLRPLTVTCVTNYLPCLTARDGETEAISHVVKATLELLNEKFAGDAGGAVGLFVVLANWPSR